LLATSYNYRNVHTNNNFSRAKDHGNA